MERSTDPSAPLRPFPHGTCRSETSALAVLFHLVLLLLAVSGHSAAQEVTPLGVEERFVPGEAMTIGVVLDTGSFLNGGYPIDTTGAVELPVLGKIAVGGKSRNEVETYLAERLSNYLKDTHVKAVPAIRLTWLGYWVKAGQYYASPSATVWEAVRQAGGIAGERNLDRITVQRGSSVIQIPLLDSYSRGTTLAAAGIKSGDIVIIPVPRVEEGFWYWFRETLTVTSQVAAILTSAMSAYIVYRELNNTK